MDGNAYKAKPHEKLLVTIESILEELLVLHKDSMETLTEGRPELWVRFHRAMEVNEKVYQAVELLESAKRTLEDFYRTHPHVQKSK